MLEAGRTYTLDIVRDGRMGLHLGRDGEELVLLPRRNAPDEYTVGEPIEVFLYTDSEDRLSATIETPKARLGDLACLECVAETQHGAFLDWGLDKDLFLPFSEMHHPVREGDRVVVKLTHGARGRVIANARLARHLSDDLSELRVGQAVKAMVFGFNDHGALVVVNRRWQGMIHDTELHAPVEIGEEVDAFVKDLRRDNKVEVSLVRPGVARIDDASQRVLTALTEEGGTLLLHDKSPPQAISRRLGISKKAFKKAVGGLYRSRKIRFVPGGIALVDQD